MRRLARNVIFLFAVLVPISAGAVEVKFGAETEAVYDSNVFRTSDDQKADGSFRFSPTIDISEETDEFGGTLRYKPTYEVFTTYTDANALSHYLYNELFYRAGPKTRIELENLFRVTYVLNFGDADTIDEGTAPVPDNDISRDEMFLFDTGLNIEHAITARWNSQTDISFDLFDPRERRNTVPSKTVSAFQNFNYAYNRSNIFSVGGGATIQMFDEANTLPGSQSYTFRVMAGYTRHFGEDTTFTIRAGPAYIMTNQDSASIREENPFVSIVIDEDTTVGELRSDKGGNIDIDLALTPGIDDDTFVPAGSVVVPDPGSCVGAIGGQAVFEGSRCARRYLRRNDPMIPGEFNAAAAVRSASDSEIAFVSSDSGSDDSTFSIFGEMSLVHNWTPNLLSQVSYTRDQSNATGLGTSAIADVVSFFTVWRPNPLWDISGRASYVKRESANDISRAFRVMTRDGNIFSPTFGLAVATGQAVVVEDSNSIDTERWEIATRIARRMTRRITMSLWAGYSSQTSANTGRNPNEFNDFTAILGFKYDFDPFRF